MNDAPIDSGWDRSIRNLVRNRHEPKARSCAQLRREDHFLGNSVDRLRPDRSLDTRCFFRRLDRSTSSPLRSYGMAFPAHRLRIVNLAVVCAAHDSSVRLDHYARNAEHRRRSIDGEARIPVGETGAGRWPSAVAIHGA